MKLKKLIVVICVLLFASLSTYSKEKFTFEKVPKIPSWVDSYYQKVAHLSKYEDSELKEVYSPNLSNIKLIVEKKRGLALLNYYHNKVFAQNLLESKLGFDRPKWSGDGKYFAINNVVAAYDISALVDLYVYELKNQKFNLIYKSTNSGGLGFSNSNKFFICGVENSLLFYNLKTKKGSLLKVPSDYPGKISGTIWRKDDKEIFIFYVTPVGTINFLIKMS
jgi:hypothetical protein